jgi:phosphatidate cytidylyltransferase
VSADAPSRLRALGERLGDLRTRAIWGAAIGVVGLALILIGGFAAAALVAAAAGAMAWEWRRITLGARFEPILGAMVAVGTAAAVLLAHHAGIGGAALYLALAAAAIGGLDSFRRLDWRWSAAGMLAIGFAAASFAALRDSAPFGLETALWIAAVVVACDVGAYFAGRLIGGPKLWPRVSPKKTWAGLGGGMALSAIVGVVFSAATTGTYALQVATVSAIAALVAQGGDLAESSVKRRFGVKDSGTLIPGHGGALDRLDGFCAATLVAAAVAFARGKPVFIW